MPEREGSVALLRLAYDPLLALADDLDEPTGWTPTALPGWAVRDLVLHLTHDAQRALVALATPADGPADTDAVSYWSHWQPGDEDADVGLRATRADASSWPTVRGLADRYAGTARAVLHAAGRVDCDEVVATQGHRLRVADLLHTLAVEAAVHHLDLVAVLPDPPAPEVLALVRQVLDGLLGTPAPAGWDDVRWALVGTGRAEPTAEERAVVGDSLPLFG